MRVAKVTWICAWNVTGTDKVGPIKLVGVGLWR